MKEFKIPVGKILATCTVANGIGASIAITRAFKKAAKGQKRSFLNVLAESFLCSAVENMACYRAVKLWKADYLDMPFRITQQSDYNTMCNDAFNEVIDGFMKNVYTEEYTIAKLCEICRDFHQTLSPTVMIELIHKMSFSSETWELITSGCNEELCRGLVTLQRPNSVNTTVYDGEDSPTEACMLINAMYKLHALAGEIDESEDVVKFVADHLIAQYPSIDAIRDACKACELMVANHAPWVHEGELKPWLSRVTSERHCMDVALSLSALAVNMITNVDKKVAGITFYSARVANTEGFYYFVDSFPTLYRNMHELLVPKFPSDSGALGVTAANYEELNAGGEIDLKINAASTAAWIIYTDGITAEKCEELLNAFKNSNAEFADTEAFDYSIKLLENVINNEVRYKVK